MPPLYLPREKPAHQTPLIWRPASVPMPDAAYLMLPQEFGSNRAWEYVRGAAITGGGGTNSPFWMSASGGLNPSLKFTQSIPTWMSGSFKNGATLTMIVGFHAYTEGATGKLLTLDSGVPSSRHYIDSSTTDIRMVLNNTGAGVVAAGAPVTVGKTYIVAGTYDLTAAKLYINGAYINQTAYSTALDATVGVTLGSDASHLTTRASNAAIAFALIWNRALTAAEVAAHYADPYMWLREPRQVWMPFAAAVAGNPYYAYAQQ